MESITNDLQALKEQYRTEDKLNTRVRLHSYNTNKTDWNNWCFNQMKLKDSVRILELGCGTGEFWYKNREYIRNDWDITLSDYSSGMLESAKKQLEQVDHSFIFKEIDARLGFLEDVGEVLDDVAARLPRITKVKNGEIEPWYCGECEYCRGILKAEVINYKKSGNQNIFE
jgi:SAM-dependent methyltransferase